MVKLYGSEVNLYKRKKPRKAPKVPPTGRLDSGVYSWVVDLWNFHGNEGDPPRWFVKEALWEEEELIQRKWSAHYDIIAEHRNAVLGNP